MSQIVEVLEYSRAPVKDGVIRGVKIVGNHSKNKRTYPQPVLSAAKTLYEGVGVYLFHPTGSEKRKGSRQLDDNFGSLHNIRERGEDGGACGLYGDLRIRQAHPMAQMVVESDGHNFGLSHNAVVEMNDAGSEVTRIVSVNSVDLVDNPATTTTLFESEEIDEMSVDEITKAQAATDAKVTELSGKLDTVLEAIQKKPEPPPKRLQALEDIPADDGEPAPIGNSHDDFLGVLHGFPITNSKGA